MPQLREPRHQALALVALDDERAAVARPAGAAVLLQRLEERVERGFVAGQARDRGRGLAAAAAAIALHPHDAVIRGCRPRCGACWRREFAVVRCRWRLAHAAAVGGVDEARVSRQRQTVFWPTREPIS